MTTFKVDSVATGKYKANEYIKSDNNLRGLVGLDMEACSDSSDQVTYSNNNLIAAINTAYDQHLPLTLSPDILWLAIAQGLSLHVNNNAEALRHQFVDFEGKKKIEIFENGFIKGSPNNDWQHAFGQFSDGIKEYIGKKRDLIVGDYSTTTPVTRAANEIVLMEAMQRYFVYECTTMCGIPEITLLGTVEDWKSIKTRVQAMAEFDLGWWTTHLEPIVDEFIAAASGTVHKSFWQNIYKEGGGSGGPYISGWVTTLFPYLKNYNDNSNYTLKNTFDHDSKHFGGLTSNVFPNGMAKVPFVWNYYAEKFNMELAAGFTGFKVVDNVVTPNIGWAVREADKSVHITVISTTLERYDFSGQDKFRKEITPKLTKLGMKVDADNWSGVGGVIPTDKLEEVKQIPGVKVLKRGEDE